MTAHGSVPVQTQGISVPVPRFAAFLFILFIGLPLAAQERIALHPFRAAPGSEEIAGIFYQVQMQEITHASDGQFIPFPINLSRLPADIPAGGFPPWVCPSPVVTGGAPYAITGEVSPDPDTPGSSRLRLYLWQMEGGRLLGSDEMVAMDRAESEQGMPFFLEWVISWIDTDTAEPTIVYVETEVITEVIVEADPVIVYVDGEGEVYNPAWLYLGFRLGGGNSSWNHDLPGSSAPAPFRNTHVLTNANMSVQAAVQLVPFFEIQTELSFILDFERLSDLTNESFSDAIFAMELRPAILAKFVLQNETLKAGFFTGVYYYLPLKEPDYTGISGLGYNPDFPGVILGVSIGRSIGPGRLFLDARLEYDGRWFNRDFNEVFYRTGYSINIGYEFGLFRKGTNNNGVLPVEAETVFEAEIEAETD